MKAAHQPNFCPNCGCDMVRVAFALQLAARTPLSAAAGNGQTPKPAAAAPEVRTPARPPKAKRKAGKPISKDEWERAHALRAENKTRTEIAEAMKIKVNRVDALLYGPKPKHLA